MQYPYHVKFNGVDYKPFEEIPNETVTPTATVNVARENDTVAHEISKQDINKMSIAELRSLGKEIGVKRPDMCGEVELKRRVVEKLGL